MNSQIFQGFGWLIVTIFLSILTCVFYKAEVSGKYNPLDFLDLEEFGVILLLFFTISTELISFNCFDEGLFLKSKANVISTK